MIRLMGFRQPALKKMKSPGLLALMAGALVNSVVPIKGVEKGGHTSYKKADFSRLWPELLRGEAMSQCDEFIDLLEKQGFNFFTGVPCSILKNLIPRLTGRGCYLPALREDAAIGLASGAQMAGKKPVVLMQNSGLGYCLNALTSLNLIYKIPCLMIISWRGYLGNDAPEHIIMGDILPRLLETAGIPHQVLESGQLAEQAAWASGTMAREKIPVALILRKGVL